jgi:branched-chain amino acid transport system substrate-binding protein
MGPYQRLKGDHFSMSDFRKLRVAVAAAAAAIVLAAAGCSSTDNASTSTVGTTIDAAKLLGAKNPATGPAIKIGLIDDGKSTGIDHTPIVAAFNATVSYANDYLGGINGHKIEVDECATNNTPADATNCGVKMVNDKVAAVLVPVSAQDANVFNAMKDNGIPYYTYAAGSQDIILGKNTWLIVNPLATLAGPAKFAKDNGFKKAGIIIIDVPSATGPLTAFAKGIYEKAGVEMDIVAISPSVADMTPQIQTAIANGDEQFTVVGTDEFNTSAMKALKQLGYPGKTLMITPPTPAIADNVPDGLTGVTYITSATTDANDKDVQLYNAVMQQYLQKDMTTNAQSEWAYTTLVSFINAVKHDTTAADADTLTKALGSMPAPLPLPLGAGLEYQCGAKVVPLLAGACTANVLTTTLDAKGNGDEFKILDVKDYMTLG